MQNKNQVWIWVGVVVVVLAVVFVFVWKPMPSAPNDVPVHAPAGQLVSGFPSQLVLDSSAPVGSSYSLKYSSSTSQYTAQLNSSNSVSAEFTSYQSYFSANGWTIGDSNQSSPTLESIYATNDTSGVTVVIAAHGTGSQVTINYVTK